jgi:hypothetical protein
MKVAFKFVGAMTGVDEISSVQRAIAPNVHVRGSIGRFGQHKGKCPEFGWWGSETVVQGIRGLA